MNDASRFEQILAEHPFFEGLSGDYIQLIAGCAKNVRYEAGDFIFREGDISDMFYLIRHGAVSVEVFAPGRGAVRVEALTDGDVLGWSWLIPPHTKQFDARALRLTRALSFDGNCIREKCEQDPKMGYTILMRFAAVMAKRLQATRLQLLDVYGRESE